MSPEEKELLLKDLCGRLPYGVKCTTKSSWNGIYTIEGYKDNRVFLDCPVYDEGDDEWMIESIVPYLRPMSSMTEEEKKEFIKIAMYDVQESTNGRHYEYYLIDYVGTQENPSCNSDAIDWLNKNHFDYRGLIPMGLAIAVTKENNPYEE